MTRYVLPSPNAPALVALASAALFLSGCQKEEITVYRVPKEMPGQAPASHAEAPVARPEVHWDKLPAGWREEPSSGSRAATFSIAGSDGRRAEVAAIGFPVMGGSDLQFVNLWREQLGLAPLAEEQLPALVQPVVIAGVEGKLFDITGATKGAGDSSTNRIIVVLHKAEGTSWFIKMTGDPALVEQQKPAFIGFLKGLSLHMESDAASERPVATASTAPTAASGKPAWTAPAHWQALAPGAMQAAKYKVGEGKAAAEVTAVFLGGPGGALKANLDRWRGQLGLAPAAESEVDQQAKSFAALGSGARIVELSGTDTKEGNPADMIVLVVPSGNGTWFYKLMGDKSVVTREKDALVAFVKSARN